MGNNEILVAKPVRDFQQTVRSEAGLQFSRVGRSHLTLSPSPCAGPSELVRLGCGGSLLRFEVKRALKSTEDGRSMTTFYYCSVNHQSGLQSKTFSTLSYIF